MNDRWIQAVQRLMAKETSLRGIGTEDALHEAEAAATKIAELMLRHNIEMSQVERQQMEEEQPIEAEQYQYHPRDTYRAAKRTAWEVGLSAAVARAHNCRLLVGTGYLVFVGRRDDRNVAMQMFRILRNDLTRATDDGYRRRKREGYDTKGYMTSFMMTAVERIQRRYVEMRKRVVDETNSTALVLATDRSLDVWVEQNVGTKKVSTAPRNNGFNMAGAMDGNKFGSDVSLNSKAVNSQGRAAKQLKAG